MFDAYEKDGRIIYATPYAYEVIYKGQGFKPRGEEIETSEDVFTFTAATDFSGGGDSKNNGVGARTGKRKRKPE